MNSCKYFTPFLIIMSTCFLFISCGRQEEKIKTEKYIVTLEKLDSSDINEMVSEDTTRKTFIRRLFGSPAERNWLKIHRQCMARQTTDNLVFLGVSNRLGLGTIYQRGFISARDEITRDNFTDEEILSFTSKGASGNCDFQQEVSVDAEVLMDVEPSTFVAIDADLGAAISTKKGLSATIEGYQVNNLYTGRLIKHLERTTDPKQLDYFHWFKEEGNLLVTSVVQISGFSMLIELSNAMNAELKAKLEEGIVGNLGDSDIKVKFKYQSETKIKMVCENEFFVFGEVAKIKKVVERD